MQAETSRQTDRQTDTGMAKLMHRDSASNYDMLMRTQCTICLSSDHSQRRPQCRCYPSPFSTSLSCLRHFHPRPPSPPTPHGRSRGEARTEPASLPLCLLLPPNLFLPVYCPLRLSEAPRRVPSLHLPSPFFFFHFLSTSTLAMKNREVLT